MNSVLVKRIVKGVSREFSTSPDALEGVLEPAYSGGDTATTSELVDSVQSGGDVRRCTQTLLSTGAKALWGTTVTDTPRSAGGTLPQCD